MCGICNLLRGRSGCCNRRRNYCEQNSCWSEPRMKVTCASGLGTRSGCPCTSDDDCDCVRSSRRSRECGCMHNWQERDCDCCD